MKYHLLCSLLAAGTLAIPGNIVARSATASISPSAPATTAQTTTPQTTTAETTTATAETSTTTTESQVEATNVAICEHNGMTRENWIKYDLDKWTSFFATYFPQNVYNHDKEEFPNDVFSDYMIYQAAWGNEHCTVGDPTCDINVGDVSACKSFTGDSKMPNIYFILGAIKNFWEWSTAVSNSVKLQGARWQGRANDVVNTFTEHDVSTDSQSAGMALAGNVLTMLTPMTIMCEVCGPAASLYGAASGAQAIHDAAQQSAPEILQNEFDNIATIERAIYNVTDAISKVINKIAVDAINTVPDNSQELNKWHEHIGSAPQIFMNGSFADPFSADDFTANEDVFINGIASSAINLAWQAEGVFIVSAKNINGNSAKDIKLEQSDDASRVCDGDLCYFFVKSQGLTALSKGDWSSPKGVDQFDQFSVDPLEFAKSAAWFQQEFGINDDGSKTYCGTVDTSFLAGALFRGGEQVSKYVVNLPVISYDDDVPGYGLSWKFYGRNGSPTDEEHFLNVLGHYFNGIRGDMPSSYSKMWDA